MPHTSSLVKNYIVIIGSYNLHLYHKKTRPCLIGRRHYLMSGFLFLLHLLLLGHQSINLLYLLKPEIEPSESYYSLSSWNNVHCQASRICDLVDGKKIRLLLCRRVRPPLNECPYYETKQSDGKVSVMLELWGMRSILSLPSLPNPLWPGVVASERVLSIGQM